MTWLTASQLLLALTLTGLAVVLTRLAGALQRFVEDQARIGAADATPAGYLTTRDYVAHQHAPRPDRSADGGDA